MTLVAASFTDPTVFVALIGAFGGFGSIVLASVLSQRNQRTAKKKIEEIHVLVNSQMSAALKRIADLEEKLGLAAGEKIPAPAIVAPATPPPASGHA